MGMGFLRKLDLMTTPVKVCRTASGRVIKGPRPQNTLTSFLLPFRMMHTFPEVA